MIQVGRPVGGETFIGRETEIEEIKAYLKMGQSVVIIAPRRFGKTSLVKEVLRRIEKENQYSGFVDLFEYASLGQLSQAIISEVLANNGLKKAYQETKGSVLAMIKNIKLKTVVEDFEFLLGMEEKPKEELEWFTETIDFINAFSEKSTRKINFAFDEYGDILKFDQSGEIIKMMRSKIQNHDSSTYIFSGSYESVMETLFVDRKSPFYRLARIINLGYLEFDHVNKYMLKMCKKYDVKPDKKLIEDIIDFLKGHPYYCQLALQQMYLYQITKKQAPSFNELVEIIVSCDRGYLEKIWEDLSSNKESVLVLKHLSAHTSGVYALGKEHGINVSRTIQKLEGQGILYKKDKQYHYYDPVFQYWVANRINV